MQVANVTPGRAGSIQISQKQLAPRFPLAPQQAIIKEARPRMPGIYISENQGELGGQGQHLLLQTENSKPLPITMRKPCTITRSGTRPNTADTIPGISTKYCETITVGQDVV